jgi:cytochrome c oxidase subunit 2
MCGAVVPIMHQWKQAQKITAEHEGMSRKVATRKLPGIIFLAFALLPVLTSQSSAATSPRRIEVTAKRFEFEPAEITIKSGESVDLVLTSADVSHGVRIRELNIDLRASKGKPGEVKFTADRAGAFIGHCSVFCGSGHGRMTLTIHVVA